MVGNSAGMWLKGVGVVSMVLPFHFFLMGINSCHSECEYDSDGDGVCDDVDQCSGGDDTVDTDGDGIPDDCEVAAGSVLVWSTGNTDTGTQAVAAWLQESGEFTTVTGINSTTLSLSQLEQYDSVLFFTNSSSGSDPNNGDVLADFADTGRRLVVATFSWANQGGNTLSGRLIEEQMSPFVLQGSSKYTTVSLGSYDSSSAFFAGVDELSGYYHDDVTTVTAATLIGSWSDGEPLVARNENVVGVNLFPDDSYGNVSGDYKQLFVNALIAP